MIGPAALHLEAGALARDGLALDLRPEDAGWDFCSLRVVELAPAGAFTLATGDDEVLVLSLAGGCDVDVDGERFALAGRAGVFAGISDVVYAPIGSAVTLRSERGGRFALPGARARRRLPARRLAAADIPTELRGAGPCSRQVVGLCVPGVLEAERLIVSETFTPAGNWSSYPPHKHDEERDGETQQRDGGAGLRARVAHHRRSRPRLGDRGLAGRAGRRPAPARHGQVIGVAPTSSF